MLTFIHRIVVLCVVFFFKQKTAYEMRMSDWSSDVGSSDLVGYSSLVESYLGHQVDKGARFTDWSRRPLETRQLDYAISDVTHLATLFPKMLNRLKQTGRGAWLDEEMHRLADPSSEERRGGKECVRTCRSGRSPER